jgi:hypothetical protein
LAQAHGGQFDLGVMAQISVSGLRPQHLERMTCLAERGLRGVPAGQCVLVVLLGNSTTLAQALGAQVIVAGLLQIRTACPHRGLQLRDLLVELADLTYSLGELGLGLVHREHRVGWIELDQHLAALDQFGIVDAHRGDGAGNLRHQGNPVTMNISISGADPITSYKIPIGPVAHACQDEDESDDG